MKRTKKIDLRLTEDELQKLNSDVASSGLSREKYLRALIENRSVQTMPPMDLIDVLRNLQKISNNMNQIARKAHSLNFIDTAAYWENADLLRSTMSELREVIYR